MSADAVDNFKTAIVNAPVELAEEERTGAGETSAADRFKANILNVGLTPEDQERATNDAAKVAEQDGTVRDALAQASGVLKLISERDTLDERVSEQDSDEYLRQAVERLQGWDEDPFQIAAGLEETSPERLAEFAAEWFEVDPEAAETWAASKDIAAAEQANADRVAAEVAQLNAEAQQQAHSLASMQRLFERHPDARQVAPVMNDILSRSGELPASDESAEYLYRQAKDFSRGQKLQKFKTGLVGGWMPDGRFIDYQADIEINPDSWLPQPEKTVGEFKRQFRAEDGNPHRNSWDQQQREMQQEKHERDMARMHGANWRDYERR